MNKKHSVPSYANREVLRRASAALIEIPHFIFFGTLLGVTRNKDLIDGDDDVDIYIDLANRENALTRLAESEFVRYPKSFPNLSIYFAQFETCVDGYKCHLDLYFYENENTACIRDRWGFKGKVQDKHSHLLVPKKLLFPIRKISFFEFKVSVPQDLDGLCRFLYGPAWKRPLKKREGYRTIIYKNCPVQIERSVFGELRRIIYYLKSAAVIFFEKFIFRRPSGLG